MTMRKRSKRGKESGGLDWVSGWLCGCEKCGGFVTVDIAGMYRLVLSNAIPSDPNQLESGFTLPDSRSLALSITYTTYLSSEQDGPGQARLRWAFS